MVPARVLAAALAFSLLLAAAAARAAESPAKTEADKLNPASKALNERNSLVIHAGPGAPLAGQRFEPPKSGKGSQATGGAGGR